MPPTAPDYRALVVDKYCVTCHNSRLKTGGLVLEDSRVDRPGERADVWEKVIRKIRGGSMPPVVPVASVSESDSDSVWPSVSPVPDCEFDIESVLPDDPLPVSLPESDSPSISRSGG